MRYGPCLAGNLKNLVLSDQGTKHCGSALGPATISGPAATAVATPDKRPAITVEASTAARCGRRATVISLPPYDTDQVADRRGLLSMPLCRGKMFAASPPAGSRPDIAHFAPLRGEQQARRVSPPPLTRVTETTSPARIYNPASARSLIRTGSKSPDSVSRRMRAAILFLSSLTSSPLCFDPILP